MDILTYIGEKMSKTLLKVEGITKTFGHHKALEEVSFKLRAGEVHCLVGENGAGKSTLIKILSGAQQPDCGSIYINGIQHSQLTPREAMRKGISTIYQDVELIESLSVSDNIFLGSEILSGAVVNYVEQNRKSREILNKLNLVIDEKELVENLSAADKQNLQIVKALHSEAKILIMDEPTSSLGYEETRALMQMIKDLKAKGLGIIYISHYLEEIYEIGDEITILKDGKYIGSYPIKEISISDVIKKMVGRDASLFFKRERVKIGEDNFMAENMCWNNTVKDVSFNVRSGEVFGIGGLVGAGRTELANLIFGVEKLSSGRMKLKNTDYSPSSPGEALKNGICMITEDRKKYALLPDRSLVENIILVNNEINNNRFLKLEEENRLANDMIDKLQIAASDLNQQVVFLSGGNQQKVVIARWLLSNSSVFIFDEPTKGVDIGAREEIYKLIVELAGRGKTIIMISSDMPELISMSDRIGVMRGGRMTHIIDSEGIKEEELIKLFIGVKE